MFRSFAFVLSFLAGLSVFAEEAPNLLAFDTDFETGLQGWCGMNPYIEPVRVKDGAVGEWSMEFRSQVRSAYLWDVLKPDTWYTFSYRIKGDRGAVQLVLMSDTWEHAGARDRQLGTNGWRYCSYDFKTPSKVSRGWYVSLRWAPDQDETTQPT